MRTVSHLFVIMKPARRTSRAQALQVLYQLDVQKNLGLEKAIDYFRAHFMRAGGEYAFIERLLMGVSNHIQDIDRKITEAAVNWRLNRMSLVDRNVLRLGVFELCHCDDIPATVTINEMVELAKEFGEDTSPAFVNGILDRIRINYPVENKAP